ncbi:uncharacterized protein OCT59_019620 [Rhizophagus irregularis]|uniref:uncharacterized protein n=1 Tax=Rhizophagus irregularis TaxID=588596 RepID=UPI00331AE72B|nr:hypothetical protein OCT59_019620 [Rhizophagus irregularis]
MGDGRIVYLDVSPCCKSNFTYFDQLGGILEHPDTPGSFMTYLLNLNLSGWKPRKIPPTKMKVETMRNQLSNPIRFIIDHIASWAESSEIRTSSKAFLYQKYLEWCGDNVEGGKKEWQYILDHSKIIAKLREHGLGDIKEFSDISQADLPTNKATDIPIFNMPEIIPPKIISPQPDKKVEPPIASTSGTSESSKTSESPEPLIDKPEPSNKKASSTFPARQQREEHLRKWAIDHGEDPDIFMTITEKDVDLS